VAGRFRTACAARLLLLLLLALPAIVQAQFNYTTNNGTITITGYTGSGGDVTIPARPMACRSPVSEALRS
jgi:Tfp pilus assembly pilus retraction ATPase PilT